MKQESLFYWKRWINENIAAVNKKDFYIAGKDESPGEFEVVCAAFTVAELGELLPAGFISGKSNPEYVPKYTKAFWCGRVDDYPWEWEDEGGYKSAHTTTGDTEADARAKMLIYLYENNLLKS